MVLRKGQSINKNNPYYNYYMYLSNHTKTAYSSTNIDEYIRNNMGYKENVYGNAASQGTSRLYGMGTFFYYAQEKYGVNAILSLSLSRNETGNGKSPISINKNNGFSGVFEALMTQSGVSSYLKSRLALDIMSELGVIDCSYSKDGVYAAKCPTEKKFDLTNSSVFRWANGEVE